MLVKFIGNENVLLHLKEEELLTITEALGEVSGSEVEGSNELYVQLVEAILAKVTEDFKKIVKKVYGGEE